MVLSMCNIEMTTNVILQYAIQWSQSVTRLLHHYSSKIALIASRVITTKVLRPVGV